MSDNRPDIIEKISDVESVEIPTELPVLPLRGAVLYPHMVISRENRFVSDRNYEGVSDYAARYSGFLDELAKHQEEFLAEWQRQQVVLARLEDEDLRRTQLSYMEQLRTSSAEVVNMAVEQFKRSLAFDSRRREEGAEAT